MSTSATPALTFVDPKAERERYMKPLSTRLLLRLMACMKPHRRVRNWLLLCVLLRSVQLPLLAWMVAHVLSGPVAAAAGMARASGTLRPGSILIGVGAYLLLSLVTQVTFHFRLRLSMSLGEAVVHDLRRDLFAHLQKLTMGFYDRTRLGRIISRMTTDIEAVRTGVQDTLFVTLVGAGQVVTAAAIMLWVDARLFGVLMLLAPVLWLIGRYFRRRLSIANRAAQESMSRVTANLAETVNGIRVTQGFVRQDFNAILFGDLVADHSNYNMSRARLQGVFTPMLETTNQVFTAALFVVGGYLAFLGALEIEVFIEFLFLAGVFFVAVQIIGSQFVLTMQAMAGAERVFAVLDTEPRWSEPATAIDPGRLRGRVRFRHVTFGYDPDRPVLHDLCFTAEPGQTIALVGQTGSGKSSIINLIAKFYVPTSGALLIDDHDIGTIRGRALHRQMGIVLQQNFLFTGSVIDNIRMGQPEADERAVIEAAGRLDCLDMIEALPDGLDTSVGERGGRLSLGQRQLICFTRAMLADPRILILDEATSSVDATTEARIQQALAVLLAGRTSFVVAHRLSTVRHADLVLVLDRGRIVERGTHLSLLGDRGIYANLYRQFIRTTEGGGGEQ